jgi:DHA1 family multidrug resistance protein-like MFS transporter
MSGRQSKSAELISTTIPLRWIIFFCAATFFYWAALYLYQPILSVYSQSIGASLSMVGVIVASYAIPQLLFRIPIGVWFDTSTRKKPLVALGIIMTSIGALGLGLAPNSWWVFGARMVTGIGAAAWVTFAVYFAAYYTTQAEIKRAISLISFVQGSALVLSAYCGGVIAQEFGYSYTFFGAAILGVVALVFLLFAGQPVIAKRNVGSWDSLKSSVTYLPLLIVSLMGVLTQFANWSGLFGFVPVYAVGIGATRADLGIINMLCLAASAVASLAVVRLTKLWGNSFTILLGSILLGGAIIVVPLIHDVSVLKTIMLLNGLGRGLLTTILMLLSIQGVVQQQRATSMGIYQAIYAIGMLMGPLISGFMADRLGLSAVFYLSTLCCLATAGIAYLPTIRHLGHD